ncbi:MAG: hypothetical protein D6798_09390, partial [Deltaproteobacteria bacterium]
YTGALGGIGSDTYLYEAVHDLREIDAELEADLVELRVISGVAAQGRASLQAVDGRVATVLQGLTGRAPTCDPAVAVLAAHSPLDTVVLDAPGRPELLDRFADRGYEILPWSRARCVADAGGELWLLVPADVDPGELSWSRDDWELRRGIVGRLEGEDGAVGFRITSSPVQETSRLFALARRLLDEDPQAIYADAGSFVDGASSVRNDRLSLHRDLGFDMLTRLEPGVLVPGATELAKGARRWHDEQSDRDLPYIASNWEAPDDLELPDHVVIARDTAVGTIRVAFVGVVDPALARFIPELDDDGVTIADPIAATQAVIDRLHDGDAPPDAVVVLTTGGGELLERIRLHLRGADLLVGDSSFATFRVVHRDVSLRQIPPQRKGAPVTLSLDGLATVDLRFDGDRQLVAARSTPWLVQEDLPSDREVRARIQAVRAEEYPRLNRPLIPAADPDDPAAGWDPAAWSELVCTTLAAGTRADAVLLRDLDAPERIPGPLTELLVVDQFAALDVVQVHRIPGDRFAKVLDKAFGAVPVACGAARTGKARGRSIESGRTYRLVTTDRTLQATPLGEILQGVAASGPLDPAPVEVPRGQKGHPLTLRAAVLQTLREVRAGQEDGDAAVRAFLESAPTSTPGMWLLRLRGIDFSIDRFHGTGDDAFANVPETLATSPSSTTLSGEADVAVEYSDAGVAWDLRHRQSYAETRTGDGARSESADDLRWSTSIEVPAWALGADGSLPWSPYSELLYDTELSPTVDEEGNANPRQQDLSLAAGMAAGSTGLLDTLRVGLFVNRDLSDLSKSTEWGGKAEVETSVGVGFASWVSTLDAQVFADTPDADDSDLRLRTEGETKLAMPLARWLSASLYARGFLIQGRVPATDHLGFSWTLGASLDATGVFEL